MTKDDELDRMFRRHLGDLAHETPDLLGDFDMSLGKRIRREAALRNQRRIGFASVVLGSLVIAATGALSLSPDLGTKQTSPPDSIADALAEAAEPDSNIPSDAARVWVTRGRADANLHGVRSYRGLVPIYVLVDSGIAYIWFRDYQSSEQFYAVYSDADSATPRLERVEWPASKMVGLSKWEIARVEGAIAADTSLQARVGQPVRVLGVGVGVCPNGVSACARARLAGSRLAPPLDDPALAPLAFVDLRSLQVELVVPGLQTPETKSGYPA